MTLTYGFYDAIGHDRQYTAEQLSSIFNGIVTDGIFQSIGNAFAVSPDTGMDIKIGSGRAWFNNTWTLNTADITRTVNASHATLDRIDTVVLQVCKLSSERKNSILIIAGTEAASPVPPTLLAGSSDTWQYPLADILVEAAVTSIDAGDITNRIGTADCPFITGILETIDMSWLFAQWDWDFNDWFDNLVDQLTGVQVTNLQNQIDILNNSRKGTQHTLVRNYPSVELADGAQPAQWTGSNATITEEDAAGEGLSGEPNDRVLKVVTTAATGYIQQEYDPANYNELIPSYSKASWGCYVYNAYGSGSITLQFYDSVTGAITGSTNVPTLGAWVYAEVKDKTVGANKLRIRISHSAGGATFYVANPMLNIGPIPQAFMNETNALSAVAQCSHNLIKNYPSIEKADGAMPQWWESANGTLTEEDATGEGIALPPNERVLKMVASAVGARIAMSWPISWERLLNTSSRVSAGCWIYNVTGGGSTVTLRLRENGVGTIAEVTTSVGGAWTWLELKNWDVGSGGNLQLWIVADTNPQTFYIANPVLNVGPIVGPYKPRALRYQYANNDLYSSADPGGSAAGWQSQDLTTICGNQVVIADLHFAYRNTTTLNTYIRTRPTGKTVIGAHDVISNVGTGTIWSRNNILQLLASDGTFEFNSSAAAGDAELLYIGVRGYYEWE